MKLKWLLTAGFEILTNNYKILIDPFISRPPNAVPQLKQTSIQDLKNYDAILLSHGHYDHSFDVPELVKNSKTKVYCSKPIKKMMQSQFNVNENNLEEINAGDILHFPPDFTVKIIKSRHIQFNPGLMEKKMAVLKEVDMKELTGLSFDEMSSYKMGKVFGYLFEFIDGLKIIHFGSGGYYIEELEKLPRDIDIFLAPVAGREDCDKVVAEMASIFRPKMIIPHHYDDFCPPISWNSYYNFDAEVKKLNLGIQVKKVDPEKYYEF